MDATTSMQNIAAATASAIDEAMGINPVMVEAFLQGLQAGYNLAKVNRPEEVAS